MKMWLGEYSWQGRYGAYQQYTAVVCAYTEAQALGLLLQAYQYTDAENWHLAELNVEQEGVVHISSSSG